MKTLLTITLAAVLTAAATFAADTPEQIAADYREKSAAAIKRINETLEKAAVPIVADLVKKGDTAGAEAVQAQLKELMAGELVMTPHPSIVALTSSYSKARLAALEPVQKSAISRIDALLATSEGKKMDVVSALGKVKEEVEAGKPQPPTDSLPTQWSYHLQPNIRPSGSLEFQKNGTFELKIAGRKPDQGKWKRSKTGGYMLTLGDETFPMIVTDNEAVLEMSIGKRYLKVIPDTH